MTATNALISAAADSFKSTAFFPLWWYGPGFIKFGEFLLSKFKNTNEKFGFTIWVKNLFKPMFGESDFTGRLISFFMRLVNIIIRGIGLLAVGLVLFVIAFIWLAMPIVSVWMFFKF